MCAHKLSVAVTTPEKVGAPFWEVYDAAMPVLSVSDFEASISVAHTRPILVFVSVLSLTVPDRSPQIAPTSNS
eukprot:4020759-Amphidinium_carterae.1